MGFTDDLRAFGASVTYDAADVIEAQQAEIARLTAERDQALARAAAAAMEMRGRAATAAAANLTGIESQLTCGMIRTLTIDPDAQKALDRLLAKAWDEGRKIGRHWNEAAYNNPYRTPLTDGDRDE